MNGIYRTQTLIVGILCLLLANIVEGAVNSSIKIEDGAHADGGSTVNGSVTVGNGATVSGTLNTVNGGIRIGDSAIVGNAKTVNGSIRVGRGVSGGRFETVNGTIRSEGELRLDGGISAVNGSIVMRAGSQVADNVSNVNGDMDIAGSEIGGSIRTVSGDIELSGGSVVKGDLVVDKPRSSNWFKLGNSKPKIVIGPGSRVEGRLKLEREVDLYISESAAVGGVEGEMSLEDAVIFSGERP